jgi:hypothetical protein
LYLLGEFRHEGKGDERTATLRIRVMRGERMLASREATALLPAGAVAFLRQASAELIDETLGVRRLPPDATFEARQLAARAVLFHLLGSWEEAVAVAEASLLLDSRQPRMHEVAAAALASLAHRDADFNKGADVVARGIYRYLRALEHYERLLLETRRAVEDVSSGLYPHLRRAVHWGNLLNKHNKRPDVQRVAAELRERELEILLRMVRARCRAQTGDEYYFLGWAVFGRPPKEQFEILLQTVRAIQHLPDARRLTRELTLRWYSVGILDGPEGRQYLDRLMAFDNEQVRRGAVDLREQIQQNLAAKAEQQPEKPAGAPPAAAPQRILFEPVEIRCDACVPLQPGVDLVWGRRPRLSVMKKPGRLKVLLNPRKDLGPSVTDAAYDGRFAWVATQTFHGQPQLLVIEPQAERIWEIGEDDGLPVVAWESIPDRNVYPRLWVEALEPGRVLLVSWFGRMAIGTVTFDPDKGAQVDVFFEARHRWEPTEEDPWRDLHMAFPPGYVMGFEGTDEGGRPLRRVLVGAREQEGKYGRHDRPLVVDPDLRHVDVLPHRINGGIEPDRVACTSVAVYRVRGYSGVPRLERIGLPDFSPETLITSVPEGCCVRHGDKFVILGNRCWLVDPKAPPEERVRLIAARPPWTESGDRAAGAAAEPSEEPLPFRFRRICRSNHFGLLAVLFSRKHGQGVFRIVFDHAKEADLK